ncbi:hypothetical protein [Nafulsella turpanensis]|uniref:hypothetical protein n=1 Tax=Nafulsella turpanensis TaxID=1265690 RepID=UPI00034CA90D|nr:hypothetical protein [Nafulsella turpanensis]
MKNNRKEIKISSSVHALLSQEAAGCLLSHKDYVEAAIRYFAGRKLNPQMVKEGMAYELRAALQDGLERIMDQQLCQEQMELILKGLQQVLHEQVNIRVMTELLINNLHRLSERDRKELSELVEWNKDFALKRKQDILKLYQQKDQEPKV